MVKILVTGGAGYIGSHVCKALAAQGFTPVSYDSLAGGHDWAVKWGPLERGDLTDMAALEAVLTRHRPGAVIHLGGLISVGDSVRNPADFYRANVLGTVTLLEAMRNQGVGRIVFSSSAAVYGEPADIPIREDHPLNPTNPYGRTKLVCEQALQDTSRLYSLRPVSLRYFNASGADPAGEIGEAHDPETHLIPLILSALSSPRGEISVYGDDYQTPDGTCIRDYIHVTDLAEAHVCALKYIFEGGEPGAFNLGTGYGYSVKTVIAAAERITGRRPSVKICPRRPGDPARLVADPTRAFSRLAWHPTRSTIEDIIGDAWRWHKRYFGQHGG